MAIFYKNRKKFPTSRIFIWLFIAVLAVFAMLPLVYMISTAFKPLDELFLFPPRFFVQRPTLQSFIDLLTSLSASSVPFSRFLFNSVMVVSIVVAGTTTICSMGAYALVKLNVPFKKPIFSLILAALMFSPHVTQIPNYLIVNGLGMVNTYWAVIIPKLAVPMSFFLMKQFTEQLPTELLEAGRIDGASEWRTFWKIAMPALKPAWITLIVMSFVANWNDFFSPLIFISKQSMKPLSLAIQSIAGGAGVVARSGAVAASVVVITLPTIIVFLIMQSKVMETMAHSGIK